MEPIIVSLITFAFATCITPGPNNIMLTASGANFGFLRTIPHIFGIVCGLIVLMGTVALGLNIVFSCFPKLQIILKGLGAVYLLYLAWRIATSKKDTDDNKPEKPITFLEAFIFQFLNPKALMMAVTAMSTFTLSDGKNYLFSTLIVLLVFLVISIPSISIWAGFGTAIRYRLKTDRSIKVFNYSLGGLTACSVFILIF